VVLLALVSEFNQSIIVDVTTWGKKIFLTQVMEGRTAKKEREKVRCKNGLSFRKNERFHPDLEVLAIPFYFLSEQLKFAAVNIHHGRKYFDITHAYYASSSFRL